MSRAFQAVSKPRNESVGVGLALASVVLSQMQHVAIVTNAPQGI
jgi:hypothetical protein